MTQSKKIGSCSFVLFLAAVLLSGCSDSAKSNGEKSNGNVHIIKPRTTIKVDIKGGATAVAVSPDGKTLIVQASGNEKNVQIWSIEQKRKLHEFDNKNGSVLPVAISPDGKTAAYAAYRYIVLCDMATGKEIRQLRSPSLGYFIADMMFNPKGDVFVAASEGKIVGWNPNSGKELFAWDGDPKDVKSLSAQFYDGRMFVSGGSTSAVNVWDLQSKKPAKSFSAGQKGLVSVAISGDGKMVATAEIFKTIQVWNIEKEGRLIRTLDRKTVPIRVESMLFLRDAKTLVYADRENKIILYDVTSGEKRAELIGHSSEGGLLKAVSSLSLTADGSVLVSGAGDGTIHVWDLQLGGT